MTKKNSNKAKPRRINHGGELYGAKDYQKKFPLSLSKTKIAGLNKTFNLSDTQERRKYFEAKAGSEIKKLKQYFERNTFIAYWVGKKNAGKGTYSKLMVELFGKDTIGHISIGDVVRSVHKDITNKSKKKELVAYLKKHYRGYISVKDAIDTLLGRSTSSLLPTEFILAILKREIDTMPRKILFIDGFPRNLDQVSYSLYFRDLINYREDPDIFIVIDIPESVIDERMKYRVVCPKCQTPRNIKLFTTQNVGYDHNTKEFYLICDNLECKNVRLRKKEGDDLGIEAIKERIKLDDQLIEKVFSLHGIDKILLRNSIPKTSAKQLVDNYEITPEYVYEIRKDNTVNVSEKPWAIKDDDGQDAHSLLAPPVVVSLVKQLCRILVS